MLNKKVLIFFLLSLSECKMIEEPHCSKYDFEEKMLEKMVRLEFQMEIMKSEMTKSVNTIEKLKEEVRVSVVKVDEKLKTVTDETAKLEAKLWKTFNVKREELENHFKNQFAALEKRTSEKLDGYLEELKTLRGEVERPTIAFKARLNTGISVSNGQTFVFPTVLFNAGDAYSTETGRFTATVSGPYLFTAAFCMKHQKYLVAGLMVDGTKYTVTLLHGDAAHGCMSADMIVVLVAGQRVWVEVLPGGHTGAVIEQDSYRWNTFSGTLL